MNIYLCSTFPVKRLDKVQVHSINHNTTETRVKTLRKRNTNRMNCVFTSTQTGLILVPVAPVEILSSFECMWVLLNEETSSECEMLGRHRQPENSMTIRCHGFTSRLVHTLVSKPLETRAHQSRCYISFEQNINKERSAKLRPGQEMYYVWNRDHLVSIF